MNSRQELARATQGHRSVRRHVVWALLAYGVVSAGVVAALLLTMRDNAINAGKRLTGAFAQLTEQQTSPTIANAKQGLEAAAARLAAATATGTANEDTMRAALREILKERPYFKEIRVLDAQGRIIVDSEPGNTGKDQSGLPYFIRHRDRPDSGFEVGALLQSRSTGTPYIPATLTLRRANGEFSGVIIGAIAPQYFEAVWTLDNQIPGLSIVLASEDGKLLMRVPHEARFTNTPFGGDLLVAQLRAGRDFGTQQIERGSDQAPQLLAFRRLAFFPELVVAVGQPTKGVLVAWWHMVWLVTSGWVLGSAAFAGLVLWLAHLWDSLQTAELRSRKLFEASPYPVYVADAETLRTLAVSDEAVRATGWSRAELLAKTSNDFYLPEDVPAAVARRQAWATTGTMTVRGLRHPRKDGTAFDTEMVLRRIEYDGRPANMTLVRDVTERLQAERSRQAAEERNRLLFEVSPHPMIVVDRQSLRFLVVNDEAIRLLGWSREEFLAMTVIDIYPPEDVPAANARRERFTTTENQLFRGLRHLKKDGTIFESEMVVRLIEYGGRLAVLAMVMDVSERLKAERARLASEEQLRQSEARNGQLFERSPHPIYAANRHSQKIVAVNDAALELYGWSREEFLAMTTNELYPPEDLPGVIAQRKLTHANLNQTIRGRRHRKKDGTFIDVEMNVRLIDLDGSPTHLANISDVTARNQAEAQRVAAEKRLRAVMANTVDGLITIDQAGAILSFNSAAEAMFGYKEAEVLDRNVRMLMPEPFKAAHDGYLTSYLTTGEARIIGIGREVIGARKDGTTFPMDLAVGEMPDVQGWRQFVGTVRDLTDKKAAEAQLRQSQKMEAVGQLTGGIAHDFNNILAGILGNAEAMLEEEGLDADDVDRLDKIAQAVERASDLTRSLLVYSRRQPLNPRPTNANDLVITIGQLLGRALGEYVELDFVLAEDLWTTSIDRTQLETALVNLCVNARDAMPGGGRLLVETRNEAVAENDAAPGAAILAGDYVVVAVTDTGSGMSPEVQAKVFEPFFTTKEVGRGTGLGLSMVYGFIAQSGGGIRINSEVGHGTTFKLYLPRSLTKEEALTNREATPLPRGSERILVVEDEPQVRASVVLSLQSLGYTVIEAPDGAAGWAAVEAAAQPFDLLLTDVVMPGPLNGSALAEKVAARYPATRIVFMSGYSRDILTRDGRLDEDVTLLAKPFRKAGLARIVREALDNPANPIPKA